MNTKKMGIIIAVLALCVATSSNTILAKEKKFEIRKADTIGSTLERYKGKKVELKLESGDVIKGTVAKVSQHIVHIEKLSGKDFYDAVVRIEGINAVIFRARGN